MAICFSVGAIVQSVAVTPVAKVTQLLAGLEKKVEEEGRAEAAAYDKYSCFCKEQSDNKLYAIERSTAKIAHLTSVIDKLGTEIADLDGEIGSLNTEIGNLKTTLESNQAARDSEHSTFLTNLADADGAIDSVERAIQAMKDSKQALRGNAELEASLVEKLARVRTYAAKLGKTVGEPGEAYTYKYHSNDIIATLEGLGNTFKSTKAGLESDEFNAKTQFDLKQQALSNERKFAIKERDEKVQTRESKAEEKSATEADKQQEGAEKQADQSFLQVLTGDCEAKAALWDQRSTSRAAELTAISEAMSALKTGVAPNWKANKKLVGLQKHSVVTHPQAPSFLQISNSRVSTPMMKVQEFLATSARGLHSPLLSMAALKIRAAEDHFVKVRQIIKDLIQRLTDDASAEATTKQFCDTGIAAAVQTRDSESAKVEDSLAQIAGKEAAQDQLRQEIADLSAQIAANKKALLEATTLRTEESEENTKTVEDAGVGKQAVEAAIATLKAYYQPAFVQRSAYVPPDSDREGKTVGDRAPEIFDSNYNGAQDASKGILGMLEVILSDFDRTGTTVQSAETTAVDEFGQFKTANELDTSTKEGSVSTKETEISTLEDDLVTLRNQLATAKQEHGAANKELEVLHSMCIAGEETYEERVARRQKEIEALKQAHDILENWQR